MATQYRAESGIGREDLILLFAVLLAGLIPVVAVLLHPGAWGAEPTLGLVLSLYAAGAIGAGLVAALQRWRAQHRR